MKHDKLAVLKVIDKYTKEYGFDPMTDDIYKSTQYHSPSKVCTWLNQLDRMGMIEKQDTEAGRAMKITDKGREVIKAYEIIR